MESLNKISVIAQTLGYQYITAFSPGILNNIMQSYSWLLQLITLTLHLGYPSTECDNTSTYIITGMLNL